MCGAPAAATPATPALSATVRLHLCSNIMRNPAAWSSDPYAVTDFDSARTAEVQDVTHAASVELSRRPRTACLPA